jgi:hypothetical protein
VEVSITTLALRGIRRLGFIIGPLALLTFAACGGGGSSTPAVIATASPSPTATPVPNPTASGNTFAYAGSLTQTFTVYGTPAPSPSPSATPQPTATPWISTSSQTVTQNVTISNGQSFGGQSGLTEFATQETDAGQLKTTGVTSQTYLSYAQNSARANGVDVTEIGTSSTDSNGVSLQSALGSGNGLIEKLPNVPGAQWSNGAARTDSEKDPGGETITATYAADGSYQEQLTFPEGGSAAVQTNADGSGVYQTPFNGATTANSTVTVNAPSGGQIQLAYELFGLGLPASGAFTLPVWYPQTPPVLASDTYIDEGATTLPSSCKAASSYTSANVEEIVETKSRLDTVTGEYESDRITQYTSSSYGLLCAIVSDDLKTYYDYGGQSLGVIAFSPNPLRETAVSETLALQSAHLSSMSATKRNAQSYAQQVAPRPSLVRVRMVLAAVHAQNLRALYSRAHSNSGMRNKQ